MTLQFTRRPAFGFALCAGALFFAAAAKSQGALINVDAVGINITNKHGNAAGPLQLVPFVREGGGYEPENNNEAKRLDWLDAIGSKQPGQITGYNLITSSTLAQPGANEISDDNAGTAPGINANGYALTPGFSYYFTAHYGGHYAAWYLASVSADDLYQVPGTIGGVSGAGAYALLEPELKPNGQTKAFNPNNGLSNVRIWRGAETPPERSVPEGGMTLALLGFTLSGLGLIRRWAAKRS
jgi:hypothetical protein